MTLLDEVKKARERGIPDEKIVQALRDSGVQYREIADALAQAKIQNAVTLPDEAPNGPSQTDQQYQSEEQSAPMQSQPSAPVPSPSQTEGGYYPAPQENYNYQDSYSPYQQQYPQQESESSLINEIAEQVVTEKFDEARKQIEKISDLKTTIQTRVESLDERLKRIEKIIDTLQSSVLKKVGDYVTNVEDIKQELIETQKTFANVASKARKHKK